MSQDRTVTAHDVQRIVGELDDTRAAAIIASKATVAELIAAYQWTNSDDTPGLHEVRSSKVKRLCDILETPTLGDEEP
jgi:hypothetical protein